MYVAEYRALQASAMSEETLQRLILELAELLGWLCFHVYDSRRSQPGFLDLVLVRDGHLIFAELKSARGRVTPDQHNWIDRLQLVAMYCADGSPARNDPVRVFLWRPADWFSGAIAAELRGAAA